MEDLYFTHDNGARPYMIKIENKNVKIFTRDKSKKFQTPIQSEYDNLVIEYKDVKRIFIGEIPKFKLVTSPIKSFFGYEPEKVNLDQKYRDIFKGNTILIQANEHDYVFIESCIYTFTIKSDQIYQFISPVGKDDVPYPVAYGKKYVYFLTTDVRERVPVFIIPEELLDIENENELTKIYLTEADHISFLNKYWRGLHPLSSLRYKEKIPGMKCIDE